MIILAQEKRIGSKQNGIALLMLIVIILLSVMSYIVSDLSFNNDRTSREIHTQLELNRAKRALLNYAVSRADVRPGDRAGEWGFLPCPDYNGVTGEGNQGGSCESINESDIGLLPYRTLDLDIIKDGNGDCYFYAVSGSYKQSPQTGMLNEDSNGSFQLVDNNGTPVVGVEPEDRIVAIVISPGKALPGQNRVFEAGRECGNDYDNWSAYLDSNGSTDNAVLNDAADTIDQFLEKNTLSELEVNPYNDQMITISRKEIWDAVKARSDFDSKLENLAEALAMCLAEYANTASIVKRLPWPAPVPLADYTDESRYISTADLYAGRYPYDVSLSNVLSGQVENIIFDIAGCKALTVSSGITVNLQDSFTEYHHLWQNWKDHFYYALSKNFEPSSPVGDCLSDCISVDGVPYSAVVFFSGSRLDGITRNSPPLDPVDEKSDISNYLENGNDAVFNAATGLSIDAYTANATNDTMFCLRNTAGAGSDLIVTSC